VGQGNSLKSWLKHRVTEGEAEQVFFNEPLLLVIDEKHSQYELDLGQWVMRMRIDICILYL